MATDHERIGTAGGGLSRRQVLARGAVAAGVVWAAPVIRTASAYATSAGGTQRPCTKFYLVALDTFGPRPVRFGDSEYGYDEMPSDAVMSRFRPVEPVAAAATSTTSSSTTTTSSTSSTSTTSTTSTSTTSTTSTTTTTTTPPPTDAASGLGLFPGEESGTDPRPSKKETRKEKRRKERKKKRAAENAAKRRESTADAIAATGILQRPVEPGDASAGNPFAADDLGLFSDPTDPEAQAAAAATPTDDDLPPGLEQWLDDNPDVPVRYPDIPPMLTNTGDQAWAVLLPLVEDGPDPPNHQCRAVKGWAQAGDRHAEMYVDPNPGLADEEGRRLIFPNPTLEAAHDDDEPAQIDRVFLIFCCPR
jgi:hypothetical protein